jgi:hypothetical protein
MGFVNKHYFRLNRKGHGYCLLTKIKNAEIVNHPLDVETEAISKRYLSIQRTIDRCFLNSKINFTVAVHKEINQNPFVGYGCKIAAVDEYGRSGLYFIHCLEINDPYVLYEVVFNIVKLFSQSSIEQFIKRLGDVAIGDFDFEEIINYLVNETEKNLGKCCIINKSRELHFNSIRHDCSGAASVAWLTFASFLNGNDSSWKINDILDRANASVITKLLYDGAANKILNASDILSENILSIYKEQKNPEDNFLGDLNNVNNDSQNKDFTNEEVSDVLPNGNANELIKTERIPDFGDELVEKQKKDVAEITGVQRKTKIEFVENWMKDVLKIQRDITFLSFKNNIIRTLFIGLFVLGFLSFLLNFSRWNGNKGKTDRPKSEKTSRDTIKYLLSVIAEKEKKNRDMEGHISKSSSNIFMKNGHRYYKVSPNESLQSIALISNVSVGEIIELNPHDIKKDSSIQEGADLLIGK